MRPEAACCTVLAACVASLALAAPPLFSAAERSAQEPGGVVTAIAGWEPFTIRGRSPARFSLTEHNGVQVLMAEAAAASGGMVYRLTDAAEDTGMIEWRWRINNHIPGADITTREGDDFPVRVYLTFARDPKSLPLGTRLKRQLAKLVFGQGIPTAALCYVWAETLPAGTVVPNAYSDTVMMWVLQNGGPVPADWRTEIRDYRADYRVAFGAEAPALTGIILAIDTDDTGEFARSWFGDVSLTAVTSSVD